MAEPLQDASPIRAGLLCRCPRCGQGRLYSGLLSMVARCSVCDLDWTAEDAGDGPAFFVILIIGALAVALAFFVELAVAPPTWVHLLYQLPFVVGGSIVLLRNCKALLIALQYRNRAAGF